MKPGSRTCKENSRKDPSFLSPFTFGSLLLFLPGSVFHIHTVCLYTCHTLVTECLYVLARGSAHFEFKMSKENIIQKLSRQHPPPPSKILNKHEYEFISRFESLNPLEMNALN